MENFETIHDLVFAWPVPCAATLAADIDAPHSPVSRQKVDRWMRIGNIPAKYFDRVLRAAKSRDIPLTADDLVRIHADRTG